MISTTDRCYNIRSLGIRRRSPCKYWVFHFHISGGKGLVNERHRNLSAFAVGVQGGGDIFAGS